MPPETADLAPLARGRCRGGALWRAGGQASRSSQPPTSCRSSRRPGPAIALLDSSARLLEPAGKLREIGAARSGRSARSQGARRDGGVRTWWPPPARPLRAAGGGCGRIGRAYATEGRRREPSSARSRSRSDERKRIRIAACSIARTAFAAIETGFLAAASRSGSRARPLEKRGVVARKTSERRDAGLRPRGQRASADPPRAHAGARPGVDDARRAIIERGLAGATNRSWRAHARIVGRDAIAHDSRLDDEGGDASRESRRARVGARLSSIGRSRFSTPRRPIAAEPPRRAGSQPAPPRREDAREAEHRLDEVGAARAGAAIAATDAAAVRGARERSRSRAARSTSRYSPLEAAPRRAGSPMRLAKTRAGHPRRRPTSARERSRVHREGSRGSRRHVARGWGVAWPRSSLGSPPSIHRPSRSRALAAA